MFEKEKIQNRFNSLPIVVKKFIRVGFITIGSAMLLLSYIFFQYKTFEIVSDLCILAHGLIAGYSYFNKIDLRADPCQEELEKHRKSLLIEFTIITIAVIVLSIIQFVY